MQLTAFVPIALSLLILAAHLIHVATLVQVTYQEEICSNQVWGSALSTLLNNW